MDDINSASGVLNKKVKLRIKDTAITLKIVSWLQIVGGITGVFLMAKLLLQTGTINGPLLFIILIGISLFIFSFYVGKKLLTEKDKIAGIRLSLLNQALQLFHFKLIGLGFSYSAGASFLLGVKGLSIDFNFFIITSSFQMTIFTEGEYYFKINFLAVLLIIVLYDIYNEKRQLAHSVLNDLEKIA